MGGKGLLNPTRASWTMGIGFGNCLVAGVEGKRGYLTLLKLAVTYSGWALLWAVSTGHFRAIWSPDDDTVEDSCEIGRDSCEIPCGIPPHSSRSLSGWNFRNVPTDYTLIPLKHANPIKILVCSSSYYEILFDSTGFLRGGWPFFVERFQKIQLWKDFDDCGSWLGILRDASWILGNLERFFSNLLEMELGGCRTRCSVRWNRRR